MHCFKRSQLSYFLASNSVSCIRVSGFADEICKYQRLDEELQSMELMDRQGAPVSRDSIYLLLQECKKKKDLTASRRVHALMIRRDLDSIAVLGNQLIRLFSSCGSLQEAIEAFYKVSKPTVYTWNALISAHLQHGDTERALALYQEMQEKCTKPDTVTFLSILKACSIIGAVVQGRLLHEHIIKSGVESNVAVANTLVDMYAKCGILEDAHVIFGRLTKRTVVSWGAIIVGCSKHGQGLVAINLFEKMQQDGIQPDKVVFLGIFKACASIGAIDQGRQLHSQIISSGLDADTVAGNALVDMYAKCGSLEDACTVFDCLSEHSLVSWGALIAGYVQHGHGSSALEMYEKMKEKGVKPDKITFLCILRACRSMGAIDKGRYVHKQIINSEFKSDISVLNALIDMYAKCGSLEEAFKVFNNLSHPNVTSCDALLTGYVLDGDGLSALKFFERMQQNGLKPSDVTLSCALQACSTIGAIVQGRVIHDEVSKHGLASNAVIGNTLIDMYAKCGSLNEAHRVFDKLPNQNAVSWNVLISGYVQHGHGLSALSLFQRMQAEGRTLSKVVFSCAVKACGSIGALTQGRLIHEEIVSIGHEVDVIVGSSLVDMYVKCKCLDEARKVFDELQNRDAVSWAAMVAGYAMHGRGIPALQLFARMQEDGMKPDKVTFLCILKACGSVGAIRQGELVLDQIVRDGFEDDVTMGNTIIDMYVKCGRLESARKVFDRLPTRNVVAWGAMIAGYAQHGNFKVVQLYLDDMQHAGVKPDDVIFTNILAACSHAGCLAEGRRYFNSMKAQHGISPNAEQYSCMIDLLGRAGCFKEAIDYIESYPGSPDFVTWVSLLSSCRFYGNLELGRQCFEQVCNLNSDDASGYVLMSNIYVEAQVWEEVDKLQELRKTARAWKKPGMAWIEVDDSVHEFIVGSDSHPQNSEICPKLQSLNKVLKQDGYWPQLDSVMESMLNENTAVWAF